LYVNTLHTNTETIASLGWVSSNDNLRRAKIIKIHNVVLEKEKYFLFFFIFFRVFCKLSDTLHKAK